MQRAIFGIGHYDVTRTMIDELAIQMFHSRSPAVIYRIVKPDKDSPGVLSVYCFTGEKLLAQVTSRRHRREQREKVCSISFLFHFSLKRGSGKEEVHVL